MTLQEQFVTERELGVFRAAGFPFASEVELSHYSPQELFHAIIKVLQNPNARYTEAAIYALIKLAQNSSFENLPVSDADDKVIRRLGYILDSLSTDSRIDNNTAECLKRWVNQLIQMQISEPSEPLTLSDTMTKKRMERLQSRATPINQRWQVYGKVELREQLYPTTES